MNLPSAEIPQTAPPDFTSGGASSATQAASLDPDRWVDEHGDYLFSYAMLRLRDPAKSKDAVQETLLAGLRSGRTFANRSNERGWLVGILKHKISDLFRRMSRETFIADLDFYEKQESECFVEEGLRRGAWDRSRAPLNWPSRPDESLDRAEFWEVFRQCSAKLPRSIAQAFLMRELDGAETQEICATLNIKENNLWVMLHRARLALRRCLETNWFVAQRDSDRGDGRRNRRQ